MATNPPPIPQLSDAILQHLKREFSKQDSPPTNGFNDFLAHLTSAESSYASPIEVDTSLPLSQYFISTSHNSYLSGNQLWSRASTDAYREILLRRCRCIEIDVWDGEESSSSHSENEGGEVGKLERAMEKGLGRFRSGSSGAKGAEGADHRESGAHGDEVDKIKGFVRKGLTHFRSGSSGQSEGNKEPTEDARIQDEDRRTRSAEQIEPRVLHGHTATREIPFRSVCEVIRDCAFRTTNLPLIVSLEVHCSPAQQEVMIELMTEYWKQYLVPLPDDVSDQTPLPSLESLKNRILIKVKYTPPEKAKHKARETGASEVDSSDDEEQQEPVKKGKIIEALSAMGIYTRSYHFSKFTQPEARIPTHIFSMSERKLLALQQEGSGDLFKHNLEYMVRAYPKGLRVLSSNLDPAPVWRQGVQMVALNWQRANAAMMLNEALFEGTGGWVAKPEGYRKVLTGQQPEVRRRSFDLHMRVLAAQDLDREAEDAPRAFVKVELHVGNERAEPLSHDDVKNKGGDVKRSTAVQHSKHPDFESEVLQFAGIKDVVEQLSFIRIKVCDDDRFSKDRLLGWTCFRLDRLPIGLKLLPLRGQDARPNGAVLLVDSQLRWTG